MIDAYMHLDLAQDFPLRAWEKHWSETSLTYALLVETWAGQDTVLMEQLPSRQGLWRAYCWRGQSAIALQNLMQQPDFLALRVKPDDLHHFDAPLQQMVDADIVLLIGSATTPSKMADALEVVHTKAPDLRILVPHLGWPTMDDDQDLQWRDAMIRIARHKTVSVGISAIAHFSRYGYPHIDVEERAKWLCSLFGAGRVTVGTDYPHLPQEHYAAYLDLAYSWARDFFGPMWEPVRLQRRLMQ